MTYAIITLYNPTNYIKDNTETVAKQVDKVYLIDNSNNSNIEMFNSIENIIYIPNYQNLGLSAAFNKVLTTESFNDDDFILFFDQDSNIRDGHVQGLINEFLFLVETGHPVGCIGPVYYNTSSGKIEIHHIKTKVSEHNYIVKSIITSSMLVRFKDIKEIGFWNEEIFLDMADWDVCWRFIQNGKLCCLTDSVTLHHSLGNSEKKLGLIRIAEGSAFREYYQTRDCLYLLEKPYVPLKFRLRFLMMITIRPIIHFFVLPQKKERLFYVNLGKRDYKKGIRGCLNMNEKKGE